MSGLPVPSVAGLRYGKVLGVYQLAKSRRGLSLLLTLVMVTVFYVLDAGPLLRERWSPYHATQKGKIPSGTETGSITPVKSAAEEPSPEPLTSLGLEADKSFRLGSTSKPVYKAELEQFVARAFPKWLRNRAQASIDLYLGDAATPLTLPEIPHKIYQTAKREPRWTWDTSTWRGARGYTHFFFDDDKANKWVGEVFNGTDVGFVWNTLGPGIKDISEWGQGADVRGPESAGLPSVIVGIEADV
ncbi:hypothetical protein FRC10_004015 [Ceratobasidium sp. 414]|nr:hypothetical protein FRC10_004015 [Ceratobasidium sp. 414]